MSRQSKGELFSRMRNDDSAYVFATNAAHAARMLNRYKNALHIPSKKSRNLLVLFLMFSDALTFQALAKAKAT